MLYAKRHYEGDQLIEETLVQHISECLSVYDQMMQLMPQCPYDLSFSKYTWTEIVFLVVALHDMGKASSQFQNITLNLEVSESWRFRHEVLSAEFIDLLDIDETTGRILKLAILGHHERNVDEIWRNMGFEESDFNPFGAEGDQKRRKQYDLAKKSILENWDESKQVLKWIQKEFSKRFNEELSMIYDFNRMQPVFELINDYKYSALYNYKNYYYELILLLKGILITCDHLGSGHNRIKYIDTDIVNWYKEKFNIGVNGNDFRNTQKESNVKKDALLIAPTGTGKTEAAFIWANNYLKENTYRRIFYVLPYTASINGMYERLQKERFAVNKVDMKHGKSLYAYYQQLLSQIYVENEVTTENKKIIQAKARYMHHLSKEISNPIKIVTPHQIIKAFYKVKGYETLLTEFYDALFILDEIHCYDIELTSVIILVMNYIKNNLNGKLFLMSATFPEVLKTAFMEQLDIDFEITMKEEELKKYVRHQLHLLDGSIEVQIERITEDLKNGKRVLVVCNTIKKAQYMYEHLKSEAETSLILHSYFAAKDRKDIEKRLLKGERYEDGYEPVQLLVGTQAIEVSLDLDFDVIYTELAPIDALIQRFGRVYRNRKRKDGEYGQVYVCTEIDKGSERIYNKPIKLLDKTLEQLVLFNGVYLENEIIKQILNYVYGEEFKEKFYQVLKDQAEKFQNICLYPLLDYSNEAEQYFKQFDGMKICPDVYLEQYMDCIQNGLYIEAESYLMTVSGRKIFYYLSNGKIDWERVTHKHQILVAYSTHFDYDEENGLQEKDIGEGEGLFLD